MRKSTMFIAMVAILLSTAPQAYAEDPVMPPYQQPQEVWQVTYDNYRSFGRVDPSYDNKTHSVYLVRDNNDVYIKGLLSEFPDSWIKYTDDGCIRIIKSAQLIADSNGKETYFHCGDMQYRWSDGNTYMYEYMTFIPEPSGVYIDVSKDGNSMTIKNSSDGSHHWALWYGSTRNGNMEFKDGYRRDVYDNLTPIEPGFPDSDFMINVKFKKIGVNGIQGIGSDNDAAAPMYDLQGRVVDPAAAAPGIYIRNGKKIIR